MLMCVAIPCIWTAAGGIVGKGGGTRVSACLLLSLLPCPLIRWSAGWGALVAGSAGRDALLPMIRFFSLHKAACSTQCGYTEVTYSRYCFCGG